MTLAPLGQTVLEIGSLTLLGAALSLGFRHGIDWDHIAAIADITSTTTTVEETSADGSPADGRSFARLELRALWLSSLYGIGHALLVAGLGAIALVFGTLLPDWVEPIMERVVGITLLVLGAWVFYTLVRFWRGEADFRLQSRWMLVFAGVRHGWSRLRARLHGHRHEDTFRVDRYGPRAAFAVGMLHGVGAETGSQVLIIAAVGGAGSLGRGAVLMLGFVIGLLLSNTVVGLLTATGFLSSSRARSVYVVVGCLAGAFSLVVGSYFALGVSDTLPDLHQLAGLGADGP